MTKPQQHPSVAFLSTADAVGGMERIVCGLSRQFTRRQWQVRTLFPHTDRSEILLKWCAEQGVSAETNEAILDAAAAHSIAKMRDLRRLVCEINPDVVNLHYGDNFISLKDSIAVRLAGFRRCIISVHHPTPWSETHPRKRLLTRLSGYLADAVITVSPATFSVLYEAGIAKSKLHLIPCGVQPPSELLSRVEARRRLGLPEDQLVIGSLCRLVSHKGIRELIDAVALLREQRGGLMLVIAGDGPERDQLEQHAAQKLGPHVRFLGRVPDVDTFLAGCDVFALPSYMEGFGLVYVEAAFHAVPSIGTNVGGVPEAILDGETGLLVPVKDVPALATALGRLCADEAFRRRLGNAARIRAYRDLTETEMAKRYEEVFTRQERRPLVQKKTLP